MTTHETITHAGIIAISDAGNTEMLRQIAAFDGANLPAYQTVDFWAYTERQQRVIIDADGQAVLVRNFDDTDYYDADVAWEHGGYRDEIVGHAAA